MKIIHKRIIRLVSFLILFLIVSYIGAWFFAPGSYPRAEVYEFNISENNLINIIKEFKEENPSLNLTEKVKIPNGGEFYLIDGKKNKSDYWYSFYFYYPDKNQIINTWTRSKTKNTTSFAFVSVNDGLTIGNWKEVNESFFWWKNVPIKNEFEERILKGIQEKVDGKLTTNNKN